MLMEKYLDHPTDEEKAVLNKLFIEWSKNPNQNILNHMFEIISSHESKEIRASAKKALIEYVPRDRIQDVLNLWITHPLPDIRDFIEKAVNKYKLPKPLLSISYLMLDRIDDLKSIDPDFTYLDSYVQTLNPLLGSIAYGKIKELKSSSHILGKLTVDNTEETIIDLLRMKNYDKMFDNILSYPLPFICNLIKILYDESWFPSEKNNLDTYESLIEYIGVKGWDAVSDVLYSVISRKKGKEYVPLDIEDIYNQDFYLRISPDLQYRPDRIKNHDFIARGSFNICSPNLGLSLYLDNIQISDLDNLLHIPIYSSNGVELAEFAIKVPSKNYFEMDEDGTFFTVRTKSTLFSVDLDALAALILPINKQPEDVYDIIPTMTERSNGLTKMVLTGLELLSSLHRGREYTLWDTKNEETFYVNRLYNYQSCNCSLGIDIGNNMTYVSLIPNGSCDHKIKHWSFKSKIFYESPDKYYIGNYIEQNNLSDSFQTLNNINKALIENLGLNIQSTYINPRVIFINYIEKLIDMVISDIDYPISNIGVTYDIRLPLGFDKQIFGILEKYNFKNINIAEKLTSGLITNYRLQNVRGNIILINLDTDNIGAALGVLPMPKSRKRIEDTRMRESPRENITVVAKISQNVAKTINSNEYMSVFKLILRNIIIKGSKRNIQKNMIDNVILCGPGSTEPQYLDYISSVFPKFTSSIIIDDIPYTFADGAALISSGQNYNSIIEHDLTLKISNNGNVQHIRLLKRGDNPYGKCKIFEIRHREYFDMISIDCWMNSVQTKINENVYPLNDNDFNYKKDGNHIYIFSSIIRETLSLINPNKLKICVDQNGRIFLIVMSDNDKKEIKTNIHIL